MCITYLHINDVYIYTISCFRACPSQGSVLIEMGWRRAGMTSVPNTHLKGSRNSLKGVELVFLVLQPLSFAIIAGFKREKRAKYTRSMSVTVTASSRSGRVSQSMTIETDPKEVLAHKHNAWGWHLLHTPIFQSEKAMNLIGWDCFGDIETRYIYQVSHEAGLGWKER